MTAILRFTRRPAVGVWALLMAATATSWALGTHHAGLAHSTQVATVAVVAIAFLKVHLVGAHFMELRHAPRSLRLLFTAWVVVVGAVLIGLYLSGPAR